ncbi:MAG: hypothetical protein KJ941_12330 [Bacteroidetes bacterium]|nr:hypothetical protein [Bacteroidota bacterium]
MIEFKNFRDEAKTWVYQADRALTETEVSFLQDKVNEFVDKWSTHGTALLAKAIVLPPFHLILSVDGDVQASGCSIDSSVRFVKSIGAEIGIDFFNRLKSIVVHADGNKEIISYHDLKNHPNSHVFYPSVTNMNELRTKWLVPISELV